MFENRFNGTKVDIKTIIKGPRDQRFDQVIKSANAQVIVASLSPGHASTRQPSANLKSDQVLYLIEGDALVKVGDEDHELQTGSLFLIHAGRRHQVFNSGARRLLYLNFFSPPAY